MKTGGKSAILTALSVCLGARALFTKRGRSMTELLKSGTKSGGVQIALRNVGIFAFQPQEYGTSIIIEKKIMYEGSSQLRIFNGETSNLLFYNELGLNWVNRKINFQS